jgi:putative endonuclease
MYYSYVLRSLTKDVLYKGSTQNIQVRLEQHNAGLVNYTSRYMPWEIVLCEEFQTRSEAMKREKWHKTGVVREWIKNELMNK